MKYPFDQRLITFEGYPKPFYADFFLIKDSTIGVTESTECDWPGGVG
jgi:hypothetical protein